jgi:hypothetical protein
LVAGEQWIAWHEGIIWRRADVQIPADQNAGVGVGPFQRCYDSGVIGGLFGPLSHAAVRAAAAVDVITRIISRVITSREKPGKIRQKQCTIESMGTDKVEL